MDPGTVNCWYAIGVPPGFIPLFLMYDKGTAEFTIRFQLKGGLPERLAGDRMECGEPIRCAFEITEQAKQEALRLMLESTSLERSVTIATVAELDLETDPAEVEENGDDNSDEPEPNPPMDDQVEAPVDQVDEPEADS
ncbi:hypothetical protein G195_003423 [Phytophthora kernoviae 00238/432]|uniref:Uncharacterized protein n=1 Tax=Phytophthora kernoviae 00238/432 TaxID=1284355 RepID=A0A8J4SJD8_9STRA|nr:hypothetical protein G195_003423 [Phytophthora kernoviae 00238/432]